MVGLKRLHTTVDEETFHLMQLQQSRYGTMSKVIKASIGALDRESLRPRPFDIHIGQIAGKTSLGIPGLDSVLFQDLLPRGSVIVVAGPPGSGKTTMALSFIRDGARVGDTCVYVSFDESSGSLVEHCREIGWDACDKQDRVLLWDNSKHPCVGELIVLILEYKPRRLVLDPVDAMLSGKSLREERELTFLLRIMRNRGITAFLTCQPIDSVSSRCFDLSSISDCLLSLSIGDDESRLVRLHKARCVPIKSRVAEILLDRRMRALSGAGHLETEHISH